MARSRGVAASSRLPLVLVASCMALAAGLLRGPQMIPDTDVPMPSNYEDYTRGHEVWKVFPPEAIPGRRVPAEAAGPGLPTFHAAREQDPEMFIDAPPTDDVGHRCAPNGDAAGHYFYNVWEPELIVYGVAAGHPNRSEAAFVVAPGGGSIHLAWEPEGIATAEWLNSLGITAFVLKYRVPGDRHLQGMDAQRALSLVRHRAPILGLNPDRIGWIGFSHGGILSSELLANQRYYERIDEVDDVRYTPDFLALLYGVYPVDPFTAARYTMPTFAGYAEDDPCVPAHMVRKWRTEVQLLSSGPIVVRHFKNGRHGWGNCQFYPTLKGKEACNWKQDGEEFLRKYVFNHTKVPAKRMRRSWGKKMKELFGFGRNRMATISQ